MQTVILVSAFSRVSRPPPPPADAPQPGRGDEPRSASLIYRMWLLLGRDRIVRRPLPFLKRRLDMS